MKVIVQAGAVEMESGQLVTGDRIHIYNTQHHADAWVGETGQRKKKIVNIVKSKS